MGNVKPRTIQADDETWDAFQDLAWKRRLSASRLFREWVSERKRPRQAQATGAPEQNNG